VRTELGELATRIEDLDVAGVDRTELMRWDLAVHRSVYRAAGNPQLEDVLVRYDNLATRIFCVFLDRLSSVDAHVGEHVELLRAIAAGTPTVPSTWPASTSPASSRPSARSAEEGPRSPHPS
jgi:DNA-binding FadR family transcriptional regulator